MGIYNIIILVVYSLTIATTNDTIINNINNENVISNINIYQPILVNDNEEYNLDEILKTIPELKK